MNNRSERARLAAMTVEILDRGGYRSPRGQTVDLRESLRAAVEGSVLYRPGEFEELRERFLAERSGRPRQSTQFDVTNETTLAAARRLLDGGESRVAALNFASAKNPGGGFLSGAQAQEESLALCSGLYACISPMQEMYETNRRHRSCLYTDHMIYSPDVPVFRDDGGALLEAPYPVSFITAPAVNAGAVRKNEPGNVPQIEPVMRSRTNKVLTVAATHGHEVLVLGAWGCGVFQNSPAEVARYFHEQLTVDGPFSGIFRRVVFAVLDGSAEGRFIGLFRAAFGQDG